MLTISQKEQLDNFNVAKSYALTLEVGCYRRKGNYKGYKHTDGTMWVIGDTDCDIQNCDARFDGFPARQIFGEHTGMRSR